MRRGDEGERWLAQAQEDLKWARVLFADGGYHLVAFLAQQVAEKALKAVLYSRGEEAVFGQSVDRLAREAQAHFPEVAPHAARWASLDLHYVASRYPNSVPGSIPARVYDRETAQGALRLAEEVVAFAEQALSQSP